MSTEHDAYPLNLEGALDVLTRISRRKLFPREDVFPEQAKAILDFIDLLKKDHTNAIDTIEAMLIAAGWDGKPESLKATGNYPSDFIRSKMSIND